MASLQARDGPTSISAGVTLQHLAELELDGQEQASWQRAHNLARQSCDILGVRPPFSLSKRVPGCTCCTLRCNSCGTFGFYDGMQVPVVALSAASDMTQGMRTMRSASGLSGAGSCRGHC